MEGKLVWRGYVRVKNKHDALKRFATMQGLLGREAILLSCERYWKIEELFEICFETSWNCETVEAVIYDTLKVTGKLCRDWIVNGPDIYENGVVQLEGSFSDPSVRVYVGQLEWMMYQLSIGEETHENF